MDEKLIRAVYGRNPLWDPNSPYHKNGLILKKVWQEVAAELGMSAVKTKTRWKSMKDYYRHELRKVERFESGDRDEGKGSTWRHFDDMSFLRHIMTNKVSSKGKKQTGSANVGESTDYSAFFDCSNLDPESMSDHQSIPSPGLVDFAEEDEHCVENGIKKNTEKGSLELTALMRTNEALIELERRRLDILEREELLKEDDDLMFLKSLLPHLKSLPIHRKLAIRKKFQDIICEEIVNK